MTDAYRNFAYGTVLTAPSPATSGTSLVLQSGQGALMPAVPFNAVVWPAGQQPVASNAEIVRVSARTLDTLTITRAQEGTAARAIVAGDQFSAAFTNKLVTDLQAEIAAGLPVIYRKTAAVTVTNTVTETDLITGTDLQIAAGALGTNKLATLIARGDWLQNSGAARDLPRFKLKLGSGPTLVLDTGTPGGGSAGASASRFGWRIVAEIQNLGATNSQWVSLALELSHFGGVGDNGGVFATGEGAYAAHNKTADAIGAAAATIDTTAAMNVVLSVINPTATATCETKLFGAYLEVL